jgi:hypothetical protein
MQCLSHGMHALHDQRSASGTACTLILMQDITEVSMSIPLTNFMDHLPRCLAPIC